MTIPAWTPWPGDGTATGYALDLSDWWLEVQPTNDGPVRDTHTFEVTYKPTNRRVIMDYAATEDAAKRAALDALGIAIHGMTATTTEEFFDQCQADLERLEALDEP